MIMNQYYPHISLQSQSINCSLNYLFFKVFTLIIKFFLINFYFFYVNLYFLYWLQFYFIFFTIKLQFSNSNHLIIDFLLVIIIFLLNNLFIWCYQYLIDVRNLIPIYSLLGNIFEYRIINYSEYFLKYILFIRFVKHYFSMYFNFLSQNHLIHSNF